jgi:hypothetical protein
MESAISIFRKLPETKQQVSQYAKLIRQSVLDGEVEPLVFAAQVSALEQLFKQLRADDLIKDVILEEAEKYGEKTFEYGNAKFTIKESGVRYDYSVCQDLNYEELCEQENEIKEKKRERENFLRGLKPDMEVYGGDGRQLEVPLKTSSTAVAITLK